MAELKTSRAVHAKCQNLNDIPTPTNSDATLHFAIISNPQTKPHPLHFNTFAMASRYTSYHTRSSATSSHFSDPSSSSEFTPPSSSSRAVVLKSKPSDLSRTKTSERPIFSTMVKKFMDKKSSGKSRNVGATTLVIPADVIKEDLKRTARKGTSSGFSGLQKKLFGNEKEKKKEVKALSEVKGNGNGNARSLAMVLRSERELLSANKELDSEVSELKLVLEEKNREVEKLKDLCLKQREEIKALKSAILFPDVMNNQLQDLLEKQGSELKQAKQLIPTLQKQVTSLTGQLQCLAEDLAEVKADKHSRGSAQRLGISPTTPSYDDEEATNSLDFSSCDGETPGSPDDMFIKDLNPCLTPFYAKTKSKEFEMGYDSPVDESPLENRKQICNELNFNSHGKKISKSSDGYRRSNRGSFSMARVARRSDETKSRYGNPMHQRHF